MSGIKINHFSIKIFSLLCLFTIVSARYPAAVDLEISHFEVAATFCLAQQRVAGLIECWVFEEMADPITHEARIIVVSQNKCY